MFEKLAEARIQDWIRRGRPSPKNVEAELNDGSFESQLLGEVVALKQSARDEADAGARAHLRAEARKREIQLMTLLEGTGRPLAAKALADRLQEI